MGTAGKNFLHGHNEQFHDAWTRVHGLVRVTTISCGLRGLIGEWIAVSLVERKEV
jgi:hypothetical protein